MGRPSKSERTLAESIAELKRSGVELPPENKSSPDPIDGLQKRIQNILHIIQDKPLKAIEMTYMILYDISDNRVRTLIAKYLKQKGCIRIQRSVFIARSENRHFQEIQNTLKEINSYYENEDSIILVPVNSADVRSMKLIGKNVQLDTLLDPPNTLFF